MANKIRIPEVSGKDAKQLSEAADSFFDQITAAAVKAARGQQTQVE